MLLKAAANANAHQAAASTLLSAAAYTNGAKDLANFGNEQTAAASLMNISNPPDPPVPLQAPGTPDFLASPPMFTVAGVSAVPLSDAAAASASAEK